MNNQDLENCMNATARAITRAEVSAYENVKAKLWKRRDQYIKLLLSHEATAIRDLCRHSHFNRLYEKRNKLYTKAELLLTIINEISLDCETSKEQYKSYL